MPRIPWWGVGAAVVAPVAFIGGWWYAGSLAPGYDNISSGISDLAAVAAPHRWVMTLALVITGVSYLVTAIGVRPADIAGRGLLAVGGLATLLLAWIPNHVVGHSSVGHMIPTYLAFASLSVWPAVIARNEPNPPLVLRPRFGLALSLCLLALVVAVVADIVTGGATLGLRERLLTSAQSLAPLVVVLGTVRSEAGRRLRRTACRAAPPAWTQQQG